MITKPMKASGEVDLERGDQEDEAERRTGARTT